MASWPRGALGPALKETWGPSGWARQVRVTPGAKSPEPRAWGGAMDTERTPEKGPGKTACRTEDAGLIWARGSDLPQQPSAGHDLDRGWGQRRGGTGQEAAPGWAGLAAPHSPGSSVEARRGRRPRGTRVACSWGEGPRAAGQKVGTWIIPWRQALAWRHGPQSHAEPSYDKYFTGRLPPGWGKRPKVPFVLKH